MRRSSSLLKQLNSRSIDLKALTALPRASFASKSKEPEEEDQGQESGKGPAGFRTWIEERLRPSNLLKSSSSRLLDEEAQSHSAQATTQSHEQTNELGWEHQSETPSPASRRSRDDDGLQNNVPPDFMAQVDPQSSLQPEIVTGRQAMDHSQHQPHPSEEDDIFPVLGAQAPADVAQTPSDQMRAEELLDSAGTFTPLSKGRISYDDAASSEAAAHSAVDSNAPSTVVTTPQVPKRFVIKEESVSALPDAVMGYRQVNSIEPADATFLQDRSDSGINSNRHFWPHYLYEPKDLVGKETLRKHNLASTVRVVEKAGNSETMKEADFRNLSFLNRFTSDAGQLPPRRVTKLKKKVHTHLARQVKIARQMALIPPEGKLAEFRHKGYS